MGQYIVIIVSWEIYVYNNINIYVSAYIHITLYWMVDVNFKLLSVQTVTIIYKGYIKLIESYPKFTSIYNQFI